ncbi:MAG: L-glutamate gamma-semialdehyde dehydrogenase [Thermoanaerobaculia bacterium]
MANAVVSVPQPDNEPVRGYAPDAPETASLKHRLDVMLGERIEIPLVIGGEEVRTGQTFDAVCPHDHGHVLATVHQAGAPEVERAIAAAGEAWHEWSEMPWESRAAIFLKAAELLAGPWRDTLNAAAMLNQSKTVYQAEIDAACELIDFWRFNPSYAEGIYRQQPRSVGGAWNQAEYRALEGFVFAVTPFNFVSIGGNLPTAPALMGNTVLWKPASTSTLASWYIVKLLEEAGLPPGVVNFVPGSGRQVGDPALASAALAGIHFTGSTAVFQGMWKTVGQNIGSYRTYPRIVGETGGKDLVFAHPSADVTALSVALTRGAFEYQGQKCSAASRAYVPASLWPTLRDELVGRVESLAMGPPTDFSNFLSAVIDEDSFDNTMGYIEHARSEEGFEILCGGTGDKSEGYYVRPTVVRSQDPRSKLMSEEIFAPVLTVFVYEDARLDEALELCNTTSPYGLTGAVFSQDRRAVVKMAQALRHAAGNFYVNDKPTGAVVSQQPFGGSRASGTNDKAGSAANLMRWVSQRSIKETLVPPRDHRYPHMGEA